NTATPSRQARCSASVPLGYCSGISHPPNGTILAPRARWTASSGEVRRVVTGRKAIAGRRGDPWVGGVVAAPVDRCAVARTRLPSRAPRAGRALRAAGSGCVGSTTWGGAGSGLPGRPPGAPPGRRAAPPPLLPVGRPRGGRRRGPSCGRRLLATALGASSRLRGEQ